MYDRRGSRFQLNSLELTMIRDFHSWNESCDVFVAETPSWDNLPLSHPRTDHFCDGILSSQWNLSNNIPVFINTSNYWEKLLFWVWCWPTINHLLTRSYVYTVCDGVTMNRLHSRMYHDSWLSRGFKWCADCLLNCQGMVTCTERKNVGFRAPIKSTYLLWWVYLIPVHDGIDSTNNTE